MILRTLFSYLLILSTLKCSLAVKQFPTPVKNEDMSYWIDLGKAEIDRALSRYAKLRGQSITESLAETNFPKNVIIMVGDGMSMATVAGARILKGQKLFNVSGEEQYLTWERFPESAFLKTYNTDKQTGDSAATAVAMFTGVKTKYKTLGYDNNIIRGRPSTHKRANKLSSILSWAQEAGLKTGIVTNSRLTHATPAALYAHAAERSWECDAFVNRKKVHQSEEVPSPDEFADIARQLVESAPGNRTDVILGGGMLAFHGSQNEKFESEWVCNRQDGKDLIEEWINQQKMHGNRHKFVTKLSALNAAVSDQVEKVLGIFATSHLSFEYKRPQTQPSLGDLTEAAIKLLDNEKGTFINHEDTNLLAFDPF